MNLNCNQKAYLFVGHCVFSFVAGYFVSMFFEVPIMGLEKFIFGTHRQAPVVQSNQEKVQTQQLQTFTRYPQSQIQLQSSNYGVEKVSEVRLETKAHLNSKPFVIADDDQNISL